MVTSGIPLLANSTSYTVLGACYFSEVYTGLFVYNTSPYTCFSPVDIPDNTVISPTFTATYEI
jgi:hypothetical protein